MLIRFGYDITITCKQDTPMVCLLNAHRDRAADIRSPEQVVTQPSVPTSTYVDLFGNICRRFVAPAGEFSIWGDGTLEDSGLHDPALPHAQEIPVAHLPDECLLFLMGSRYCETDRLSQFAWDRYGQVGPGWAGSRRFATSPTSILPLVMKTHAAPAPPMKPSRRRSAFAGTMRISPSLCSGV